ncbi:MAG: acyltransferase family protein [Rhodobacterales bacterium]|nr:acyltransferase family protein [Rhodobacterales bacterium]
MTLGEAMQNGRANNAGLIRLVLAGAVVVSHAWPLALGRGTVEPLVGLTGRSLGFWAVMGFFFLSGLFIAESASRRDSMTFWKARARRILPGLSVALIVTVVLAIVSGARPGVFDGLVYVLRGVTLVSLERQIDGAYAANPYPGTVNGPLWSLFHEVAAYGLCWLAAKSGLLSQRGGAVLILVAAALLATIEGLPARLDTFAPLFLAFAMGMAVWQFRAELPLSWALSLILFPLAAFGWALMLVPFVYGLVMLSWALPAKATEADLSFGIYIYGWPVAQLVLFAFPGLSPVILAVVSLIAVLPFAAASWYLVEHPSIRRKALVA